MTKIIALILNIIVIVVGITTITYAVKYLRDLCRNTKGSDERCL